MEKIYRICKWSCEQNLRIDEVDHIYIIVWVFKWINFDNMDEINAKIKPHDIDDFFHEFYHIN